MKVYLVYGLTKDDSCDESYVKKAFKDKEKAFEYLNKKNVETRGTNPPHQSYQSCWQVSECAHSQEHDCSHFW